MAACTKDDDDSPVVTPPVVQPCTTEGSLLLGRNLTRTVGGFLNTQYEYDAAHRLVRMTDSPSGIQTSFFHSADGRQIVATRITPQQDTTITTYRFDEAGYLRQKTAVPTRDTGLAQQETFLYDGAGHLLRRTRRDGPAFSNLTDELEYFWMDGNTTGYSFYAALAGSTQTAEYEYFSEIAGTAVSADLPEAELLFAMGKPYRVFPKNLLRKTMYEYSNGGGGGSSVTDVVRDAGGRLLAFRTASGSSISPSDSTRYTTEYKYECR